MATTRLSKRIDGSFLLNESRLGRLCEFVAGPETEIKITADCANGMTHSFESVSALMKYENHSGSQIRKLHIESRNSGTRGSVDIEVDSEAMFHTIKINASGARATLDTLNEKLTNEVKSWRTWYWLFGNPAGMLWTMAVTMCTWLGIWLLGTRLQPLKTSSGVAITALFIVSLGLTLVLSRLLLLAMESLLPRASFAIGEGIQRHENREWIRRAIAVGLGTLILGSIVKLAYA